MGIIQDKLREILVKELEKEGIDDNRVLEAIGKVKRENFVTDEMKKYAYDNVALPLEGNQTISQPFTVAFMTQLLDVRKDDKVLEVGTGSGYQSAVIKELGGDVYTIERIEQLYIKARETLSSLGYKIHFRCGDGTLGWKEFAPFDRIIVTAGAPQVPRALLLQLKPGGKLVIPVGSKSAQELYLVERSLQDSPEKEPLFSRAKYFDFRFVPLIGEEGWEQSN